LNGEWDTFSVVVVCVADQKNAARSPLIGADGRKDEDDEDPQQLALSFVPSKKRKRHRFFEERKLQVVESF
jgi:hypothetical protein